MTLQFACGHFIQFEYYFLFWRGYYYSQQQKYYFEHKFHDEIDFWRITKRNSSNPKQRLTMDCERTQEKIFFFVGISEDK